MLSGKAFQSDVRARGKSLALCLPAGDFREMIMTHPHVLEYIGEVAEQSRKLQICSPGPAMRRPRTPFAGCTSSRQRERVLARRSQLSVLVNWITRTELRFVRGGMNTDKFRASSRRAIRATVNRLSRRAPRQA